jgi:hypothetical protein
MSNHRSTADAFAIADPQLSADAVGTPAQDGPPVVELDGERCGQPQVDAHPPQAAAGIAERSRATTTAVSGAGGVSGLAMMSSGTVGQRP